MSGRTRTAATTGVYTIVASDWNLIYTGNYSVSLEQPWIDLGGGTAGINGVPSLEGSGTLVGGTTASLLLTGAPANAPMLAWVSVTSVPISALGGTVHAAPFVNQFLFAANASGAFTAATTWPTGLPAGSNVWFQFIVQDASSIHGLTLSNGLKATTP